MNQGVFTLTPNILSFVPRMTRRYCEEKDSRCFDPCLRRPTGIRRFHGVFAPNSLHRVWVTSARRGKGSPNLAADQDEKTPAQRHVAMIGFCSCKTGIHAIHGNNMGSETETGIQH